MQASATASPTDILALGEAMIEFNEARASDAHAWLQGFGGDTSNMAIRAARLGARSGYATRVGNDAFGRRLIELWKRERVAVDGGAVGAAAATGGRVARAWPSTPTRRPASTSSRTTRAGTRFHICARDPRRRGCRRPRCRSR